MKQYIESFIKLILSEKRKMMNKVVYCVLLNLEKFIVREGLYIIEREAVF